MSFFKCYLSLLCVVNILATGVGRPNFQQIWNRSTFGLRRGLVTTITVDHSGSGDFKTIQSAIDSVHSQNKYWVKIIIRAGIYREKLTIPREKPYIILQGSGMTRTHVVWDDHETISQSPTFNSQADSIVVRSMTFVNSYNHPAVNKNPRAPAVAAMVSGDKTEFFRCGFYGLQDTLWDDHGRHLYVECTIEGAVDFIFGGGQSLFEGCSISVIGGAIEPGFVGYITAQGRDNPNDGSGFFFSNCQVYGTGSVFLGRAWRPYSRVVFYNSNLSNIIVHQGWDPWNNAGGHENQLTFAEYGCYGPGSDTSRRVKWGKKLSRGTLKQLVSRSYIDSGSWLERLPQD